MWWIMLIWINMDSIWFYPQRQHHKNPPKFSDNNNWTHVLFPTPIYFSLKSHSLIAKRKCTCCKCGLALRVKPQHRKSKHDEARNMSGLPQCQTFQNIKSIFGKKRQLQKIFPRWLAILKQSIWIIRAITAPCAGSFMKWGSLDCASQKHVLGGFFTGMMQKNPFIKKKTPDLVKNFILASLKNEPMKISCFKDDDRH